MCASGHPDRAGCPPCIDHLGSARFFLARDPPRLSAARAGRESRSRSCRSDLRAGRWRRPSAIPGMSRPASRAPQRPSTWRERARRSFSRAQQPGATALRRRSHPWPWRGRCGHCARRRIRTTATGSSQRLVSRSASSSLPIQVAMIPIQTTPPSERLHIFQRHADLTQAQRRKGWRVTLSESCRSAALRQGY